MMSDQDTAKDSALELSDDSQSPQAGDDEQEEVSGVKEVFVCGNCPTSDYLYLRVVDLQRHSTQMHVGRDLSYTTEMRDLRALACSVCGKTTDSIRKLSGHASRNHPEIPKAPATATTSATNGLKAIFEAAASTQTNGTPLRKPAAPPSAPKSTPALVTQATDSLPKRIVKRPFAQEAAAPPLQSVQPAAKRAAKIQPHKTSNGTTATTSTAAAANRNTSESLPQRRVDVCERARQFADTQPVDEALAALTFSPRHEWAFLVASGLTTVGAIRNCPQSELVLIAKPHVANKRYHLVALCGLANVDPSVFSN